MPQLSELTLKEKLAVQKVDKWTGFLGHIVCGFDAELNPIIETDSVVRAVSTPGVLFVREKLTDRKRYYKVVA